MTLRKLFRWSLALAVITVAVPRFASAQENNGVRGPNGLLDTSSHQRPHLLSFFATVPWNYGWGIGLGARYQIPLVHDGFLPRVNDSFALEFGADLYYAGGYCYLGGCGYGAAGLTIPVEAMWTFHLLPKLEIYAKLGLGVNFYFGSGFYVAGTLGPLWFHTAAGLVWKFSPSIYLRVETGWPTVRVGLGIPL